MTTLKSFAVFWFLVTSACAQTSVLPEVHVKLTLAEPKTTYKIGEPIIVTISGVIGLILWPLLRAG